METTRCIEKDSWTEMPRMKYIDKDANYETAQNTVEYAYINMIGNIS